MDAIVRAVAVYAFLLIVFRVSGKRSLAQITTFDFVLLLIISEITEQPLVGDDNSMTKAGLVIVSLLSLDILLSALETRFRKLGPWLDDVPLILVSEGQVLQQPAKRARISEEDILEAARSTRGLERMDQIKYAVEDILEAARSTRGLERMDQIKYAVLERTGAISIIPHQHS